MPDPTVTRNASVPTPLSGLKSDEVVARASRGQANTGGERTSRTLGEILRANLLTRFNFILGSLFIAILATGQLRDGLFGIVLVANALIGIIQEVRAKRTLDRLAVLNAPRARVVRDGDSHEVPVEEVVIDDIVSVHLGDQIVADGFVRTASGLQVDESLLTGESEAVDKEPADAVLSGSFVVAGSGLFQAAAVGTDAYARKLAVEARRFAPARSELIDGINRILRYVTWAIAPVAALLVVSQIQTKSGWRDVVTGVVAGVVAMVPQGLVLLTSIAFGVAAVTLARAKVLVQELPAVEGLARVDVICFDKTGTLTDGTIAFDRIEKLDNGAPVEVALGALASDENRNATLAAIAAAFPSSDGWARTASIPFSSARKWSAATFDGHGTWVLGAPEMIIPSDDIPALGRAADLSATGQRVLMLARTDADLVSDNLPAGISPVALVLFSEQVRADATHTIAYFQRQGVATKVISGDSPHTVAAVARQVGQSDSGRPIDARELPEDSDALARTIDERSVFGRVTPRQKEAMVTALKARGHTIAMTGDGVNDALALKLSDIGIAMGTGAAATKAVAQLVLLDGQFAAIPGVVAEGRRVVANIERVANVFITKTVWAALLAVAVGVALWPYPFLPRHLTIIDTLTIGVPGFFLALAPNLRRYIPGFIDRVLRFTIPAGFVVAVSIFAAYALMRLHHLPLPQQRTSATIVAVMLSLSVLIVLALPLTWRKVLVVGLVIAGFVLLFPFEGIRNFFALELPNEYFAQTILIGVAGVVVMLLVLEVTRRLGIGAGAAISAGRG
jgi:cation-transporting ATPase E